MLRIRLLLGLLVLGANLLQGGCQQALSGGIQKLHLVGSDGRIHVYEDKDQNGDWREVGIIVPAPRGMKFQAPSEPDLPPGSVEHGAELGTFPFKVNCGVEAAFFRYRNATSQPIELVFLVTNESKRCPVQLVGRLKAQGVELEPTETLIANGDPGGKGGGSIEIPPDREMVFAFRCVQLEEGDFTCLGRIDVSRH